MKVPKPRYGQYLDPIPSTDDGRIGVHVVYQNGSVNGMKGIVIDGPMDYGGRTKWRVHWDYDHNGGFKTWTDVTFIKWLD